MARKFLTNLDMSGNQLLNATFEKLAEAPTTGNFEGRMYYNTSDDLIYVNDGSGWTPVGSVTDIQGTPNEVDISASIGSVTISLPETINANTTGNAATATALQTSRTISLGGDLSGSASFDGSASITITATVQPDSVALGTDTTGNYVASVGASDGISASGTGEGASVSLTNTDKGSSQNIFKTFEGDSGSFNASSNSASVTIAGGTGISTSASTGTVTVTNEGVVSLAGTINEVEVSASVGTVTVGLPDDVIITNDLTVGNDLVIQGDLTVSGTTTTVNTETINLADNIITLNSNIAASATPTENAGFEINRGSASAVALQWNETLDVWEATTNGSTYKEILLSGDAVASDISDFNEAAQDAVGGMLADTATIDLTYTDGTPELKADVKLQASNSYLLSASGLAVDIPTLEAKLVTDSFTKKASASVGNASATSFAVVHSLNTEDVIVQVFDNNTHDTVETDVVRTDVNTVTVSFTTAPASNAYRVVVIG